MKALKRALVSVRIRDVLPLKGDHVKYKRKYFGSKVFIHHYKLSPYPWTFSIKDESGKLHRFGGLPNKCETEHSALMRAWWRCKWLSDGTFKKKYT